MIPPALKNAIKNEIKACIVEEGRDAEDCMNEASHYYDLDDNDKENLLEQLANNGN